MAAPGDRQFTMAMNLTLNRSVLARGYFTRKSGSASDGNHSVARSPITTPTESAITERASRVAKLFAAEKKSESDLVKAREALCHALHIARQNNVPYKHMAIAIVDEVGLAPTESAVAKVDSLLRQRVVASRNVRGTHREVLAKKHRNGQVGLHMSHPANDNDHPFIKTKVVTETRFEYAQPEFVIDDDPSEPEVADIEEPAGSETPRAPRRR